MQCWKIQDVVFFYQNLIYSKVFSTIFGVINPKLGIPQGGGGGTKSHFGQN